MVRFGLELILELNGARSADEIQKLNKCLSELLSCPERGVHLSEVTYVSPSKKYERITSSFLVQTTHQTIKAIEAAHIIACQMRKMFRDAMYGEEAPKITEIFFPNLVRSSCPDYPAVGAIIDSATHDIAMTAVNLDDILNLSDVVSTGKDVQNKNFRSLLTTISEVASAAGIHFTGEIISTSGNEVVETVSSSNSKEEPDFYRPFKSKTKH